MNSGVSNTSTPIMNSAGNNTFTPMLSPECKATLSKYAQTCAADFKEFGNVGSMGSNLPKETQECAATGSCTPKQKQEVLKLICPAWKKVKNCMGPAVDCILEAMPNQIREPFTEIVSDCDAFSASGGSTNVASLFSILAFSLFL